jgi:NADP-dependent 3-hydroxy acid dehydrogenase YdfG
VRALWEGLRQESKNQRVTVVSPSFTSTEFAQRISDPLLKAGDDMIKVAIPAAAIAEAIGFAISPGRG